MGTTTITNTLPLILLPLPSGNTAAIAYVATMGDIVNGLLLASFLALFIVHMWRTRQLR